MMRESDASRPDSPPIEAGEIEIRVTVMLTASIR